MTRTRVFTGLLVAGLLLAGCAGEASRPATSLPTATEEPTMPAPTTITGALGGDAELEGGCAWVDADDARYEVMWPEGYRVEFEPLRLLGPDGEVVAAEGDTVTIDGAVAPDMASFCQVGVIFRADAVTAG